MKKILNLFLVLVILLGLAANGAAFSVYPDEYVLVKQFGAVENIISEPGLNFKIPFIQSVQSIPKYEMCYDIPVSSVTTSDKKIMEVDSFVLWKISDPLKYVTTLGASQVTAESRLNNIVYNAMKNVISGTTQDEIISGRDGKLAQNITEKVGTQLDMYGIRLLKVETKMLDLPDENKESVYQRMISERNNIAARYTAEGDASKQRKINETDKQVRLLVSKAQADAEKIKAEGEAEYMRILAEAYNDEDKADFYNYVRSLEALKTGMISKAGTNVIVLDENSEFARILNGKGQ